MNIKEVIVVEGYHDSQRLKQFFNVETIITNGSAINQECIDLIKKVNKKKGVIIFLDPDYPGEKIRNTIIKEIPNLKHAYIDKNKAIDSRKKKVGIEHASKEDLLEALSNTITYDTNKSLSWEEYINTNLMFDKDLRKKVSSYLKIGKTNNKTLFKRLNMLNIKYDMIIKIIGDINEHE